MMSSQRPALVFIFVMAVSVAYDMDIMDTEHPMSAFFHYERPSSVVKVPVSESNSTAVDDQPTYQRGSCAEGQFTCDVNAHPPTCLSVSRWCDNIYDCANKQDELSCKQHFSCPSNHVVCGNGECVPANERCDGFDNCGDNTDEEDCEFDQRTASAAGPTTVHPKSDVIADIVSNNQQGCKRGEFKCPSGPCINVMAICDGFPDCPHREDENTCPAIKFACPPNKFRCESTGMCIELSWQCDNMQDCADGSDERYCNGNQPLPDRNQYLTRPIVTCSMYEFRCHSGPPDCIPRDAVCDKYANCVDASDEGDFCGACDSYGCQQSCIDGPLGPSCQCSSGQKLDSDGKSCIDLNECVMGVHDCDHVCVNMIGSFHCACHAGFVLDADERTCVLQQTDKGSLIVVLSHMLRLLPLNSTEQPGKAHESVQLTVEDMLVDVDVLQINTGGPQLLLVVASSIGLMLAAMTTSGQGVIYTMNDATVSASPLIENLPPIADIAVDANTGNMYLTTMEDLQTNHKSGIMVCSPDGRFCRSMLKTPGIGYVKGLAIDSTRARMYWAATKSDEAGVPAGPCIHSASLDGTDMKVMVDVKIARPSAIAMDTARNRLLWADNELQLIESLDLTSGQRVIIEQRRVHRVSSLQVFGHRVFWTDVAIDALLTDSIRLSGTSSGSVVDQFHSDPLAVVVDHPANDKVYDQAHNPCDGVCAHLCVVTAQDDGTLRPVYLCPDGYHYDEFDAVCRPDSDVVGVGNMTARLSDQGWSQLCGLGLACAGNGYCVQMQGGRSKCMCNHGFEGTYCEVTPPSMFGSSEGKTASVLLLLLFLVLIVAVIAFLAYRRRESISENAYWEQVKSIVRFERTRIGDGLSNTGSALKQSLINKHDVKAESFGNPMYSDAYDQHHQPLGQHQTTVDSASYNSVEDDETSGGNPKKDNDSGISASSNANSTNASVSLHLYA